MSKTMMLAAAVALLPGLATAAPVIRHSPQAQQETFQRAGETDTFKVALDKGRDYYVSALCDACTFRLRGAGGKVLGSGQTADWDSPLGFPVRAPYQGGYFLEVTDRGDEGASYPAGYQVTVAGDCAAGPATRCGIALGGTVNGNLVDGFDDDTFRLQLEAGQSCTVRVASGDGNPSDASVAVLDPNGDTVAYGTTVSLTAAATGPYLLEVGSEGTHAGGAYVLSVAAGGAARR